MLPIATEETMSKERSREISEGHVRPPKRIKGIEKEGRIGE